MLFDTFVRLLGDDFAARRRESLALLLAMDCFFIAVALFV